VTTMTHALASTRFGNLAIPEDATIAFPEGLVGLDGSRFALLPANPARGSVAAGAFAWLHSLDDPALALPVTRPRHFFPDYEVVLDELDAPDGLRALEDPARAEVWVTVRAAERLEDFVANLRAPILVAEGQGWQVINRAEDAPLRAPLPLPAAGERAADGAARGAAA